MSETATPIARLKALSKSWSDDAEEVGGGTYARARLDCSDDLDAALTLTEEEVERFAHVISAVCSYDDSDPLEWDDWDNSEHDRFRNEAKALLQALGFTLPAN